MKKLFVIAALIIAASINSFAQESKSVDFKQEGKNIVVASTKKKKSAPKDTGFTYEIDGIKYPVYQGGKGALFIKRVSKNTGKEYTYYLPKEIQIVVKKQLNNK